MYKKEGKIHLDFDDVIILQTNYFMVESNLPTIKKNTKIIDFSINK